MNRADLEKAINFLNIDIKSISATIRIIIIGLLNIIETIFQNKEELKEENQKLKDEINHLKGEQGKPDIKAKNSNKENSNHSSEKERKGNSKKSNKKRNRKSRNINIKIDREETCKIDRDILPEDAQFKGYSEYIVQDIKIVTDNVKYKREIFYSPSTGKTYTGKLPDGVEGEGEFGIGIRSLIPLLKSECNMTEKSILDFFQNFGIYISSAYISNRWTKGYDIFHDEKNEIYKTGLSLTTFQQIDDTGARVKGENHYTQIVCSPYYTAYFTTPKKNRLTVLDVFRNFAPRKFLYNQHTIELLNGFNLSQKMKNELDNLFDRDKVIDEEEFEKHIKEIKIGPTQYLRVKEALAIAEYHSQNEIPVIKQLICDDAPQFKVLTPELGLCWVHEGRHYKKLNPAIPLYRKELDDFSDKFWKYYHKLKEYKQSPNEEKVSTLSKEFDELFSIVTGYDHLDDRIGKTLAKKKELLLVLKYPELPIHNNASELSARVQVRDRDVSLHTMSEDGTKVKDTFMTISQTAKKLGIRTYEYIYDRVSGAFEMPSLASIMLQRGMVPLNL
jgi:regulator of replication initiation timing